MRGLNVKRRTLNVKRQTSKVHDRRGFPDRAHFASVGDLRRSKRSNVRHQTSKFKPWVGVVLASLLLASTLVFHVSRFTLHASTLQYPTSNFHSPTFSIEPLPWVEPRSLNITNLVGQVPDGLLKGVIISAYPWDGIVQFESSSVCGDTMVITTTIHGRLHYGGTNFGCLGQVPRADEMGSAAPPSHLKVYAPDGLDVTGQIIRGDYWPANLTQPLAGTATWGGRYDSAPLTISLSDQGLELPANVGCDLYMTGSYTELIGVFTLQRPSAMPFVEVVAVQQASYRSYIGVGEVGRFRPLMDQLRSLYPDRHSYIDMSAPPDANYLYAVYQPMPGDYPGEPYDTSDPNRSLPSAGTTRLRALTLSGDLTNYGAFPLKVAWQDADLTPSDATYLPVQRNPTTFTAPEFVIPPGVAYNDCFVFGNCPSIVLDEIYHTRAPITLVYLSVSPPTSGCELIPLKFAGPYWRPGVEAPPSPPSMAASSSAGRYTVYLPALSKSPDLPQCPCGYFNEEGQMIGYVDG